MFTKVKELFQKETVCCIAFLLAVISMCFVVPSKNYISYIDFQTLGLLFCLMTIVAGLKEIGIPFGCCRHFSFSCAFSSACLSPMMWR